MCYSLTTLPDISKWNTSNVIDMSSMFYNCKSLISLPDISSWNLKRIDDISFIFHGCHSLLSLPDISKWNSIKYGRHLFTNCFTLMNPVKPVILKK